MKLIYVFLTTLLLGSGSLMAQPVLTSATTAGQIGDSYTLEGISISGLVPGTGGANANWDFSSVSSNGSTTLSFVDPASTPDAASFPTADVAYSVSSTYDYYASTSTSYARLGAAVSGQVTVYSNPQIQLEFPLSYGTTWTDSFQTNASVTSTRRGTITGTVDGYGTLITPAGTFQNALRIKYVEDYQDEVNGTATVTYDSEIYVWYVAGTHFPVFSMTNLTINGFLSTSGSYMQSSSVSSPEAGTIAESIQLFPNPAEEEATLRFELSRATHLNLSIVTLTGEEIRKETLGTLPVGLQEYHLRTDDLAAGMYLVRLQGENKQQTLKLTVK